MKQFSHYHEWKAYASSRGFEFELDGSGKLVAHADGDERGIWSGGYGGAGYGWFF